MDLAATSFGEIYDTVLLLGLLMYLPASEPVTTPCRQLGQPAHLILRKADTAVS